MHNMKTNQKLLDTKDKCIKEACLIIADNTGSCPFDAHKWQPTGKCEKVCNSNAALCWQLYIEEKVANNKHGEVE